MVGERYAEALRQTTRLRYANVLERYAETHSECITLAQRRSP